VIDLVSSPSPSPSPSPPFLSKRRRKPDSSEIIDLVSSASASSQEEQHPSPTIVHPLPTIVYPSPIIRAQLPFHLPDLDESKIKILGGNAMSTTIVMPFDIPHVQTQNQDDDELVWIIHVGNGIGKILINVQGPNYEDPYYSFDFIDDSQLQEIAPEINMIMYNGPNTKKFHLFDFNLIFVWNNNEETINWHEYFDVIIDWFKRLMEILSRQIKIVEQFLPYNGSFIPLVFAKYEEERNQELADGIPMPAPGGGGPRLRNQRTKSKKCRSRSRSISKSRSRSRSRSRSKFHSKSRFRSRQKRNKQTNRVY